MRKVWLFVGLLVVYLVAVALAVQLSLPGPPVDAETGLVIPELHPPPPFLWRLFDCVKNLFP
jgi:hypothetical protein